MTHTGSGPLGGTACGKPLRGCGVHTMGVGVLPEQAQRLHWVQLGPRLGSRKPPGEADSLHRRKPKFCRVATGDELEGSPGCPEALVRFVEMDELGGGGAWRSEPSHTPHSTKAGPLPLSLGLKDQRPIPAAGTWLGTIPVRSVTHPAPPHPSVSGPEGFRTLSLRYPELGSGVAACACHPGWLSGKFRQAWSTQ